MSLLLNLINYSSTLQNEYRLSLPKEEEKDERAKSLHVVKIDEQNQRAKMSSKSLSKLFPDKPEQNLNPKTRILHRIHHLLSLKCKKHYYGLFVTLETLKKKNLYLTPEGEFEKRENKKIEVTNSELSIKTVTLEDKKVGIFKFLNKIEEIQKIYLMKEFEQHLKVEFFNSIKNQFKYKNSLEKLVEKVSKSQEKLQKYEIFKKLKKANQFCFKIEILSTLISSLAKKYAKKKREISISEKAEIFRKIELFVVNSSSKEPKVEQKTDKIVKETNENDKISSKILLESEKIESSKESIMLENQSLADQSEKVILCEEADQETSSQEVKPLQNLKDKLTEEEKRKFERNKLYMTKSLFIKTELEEKPMIIEKELHNDKASNFCTKIPKNYIRICYNDANDEQSIFSNEKIVDSNQGLKSCSTNIFKESRVIPYRNKTANKIIENNINSMLRPFEPREEEIPALSISDISEISMLRTEKSTNTLFNDKSFSTIGTDAVNFKNSLVHERESLKEGDRNFMKKRPNCSHQENSAPTKSFLRNTIDSKTKIKLQDRRTIDRSFSKDKVEEVSARLFALDSGLNENSCIRESYWTRPPSPHEKGQSRLENEIQKDHTIFSNNTSYFYENQNIYPTRDDSTFINAQKESRTTIQNQPQFTSKNKDSKEKSFIKLMSKREIPFLKHSK